MTYHELTPELARKVPWGIEEVDVAVKALSSAGAPAEDIEEWLVALVQGRLRLGSALFLVRSGDGPPAFDS